MWLLEVNTGPVLMETDPLDVALVKDIVDTVVVGDGSPKGGWTELPHATVPTAAAAATVAAAVAAAAADAVVVAGGAAVAGEVRPGVAKADAEAAAGAHTSCATATTGTHTTVHAPASEGVPPDNS